MPNSKQIVYLSQSQYTELITNGSITVDGVTVTYDENDIYVTPQVEPVTDVRVAGTSVSSGGVANIPIASSSTPGVVRIQAGYGIKLQSDNNSLRINEASDATIKQGIDPDYPIVSKNASTAAFYGLAKIAGHDEASSIEPLGTYTPEAKGAIQQMLGVSDLIATAENALVASKSYAVGDVFTANGKLYKATAAIATNDSIVLQNEGETVSGANAVETKVGDGFVKFTDYASSTNAGVVKINQGLGISIMSDSKSLTTVSAQESQLKAGTNSFNPITSNRQHFAAFYGLAKVAGADEKDSTLPVGQYTDTAKAAIRSMLGATSSNVIAVQDTQPTDTDTKIWLPETAETPVTVPTVAEMGSALAGKVGDVQIDGTSIVSEGIATIPVLGTYSQTGLVQIGTDSGLMPSSLANGSIMINPATDAYIKAGNKQYFAITTTRQHAAAFYGLAKASGDTTQSSSSNAVGTYTDNAKASIKAMLGIQDGSTGTVDVTGATPTINAVENTRYVCGEVTSLSFTPPSSGISIVRFTSGSTVTVLTIPNTVKFPEWFDPTALETNTIYEICVTDGTFGAVMSWAQ